MQNKRFSEKIELKIGIESMVGCGGSCNGCALTSPERMSVASSFFDDELSLNALGTKLTKFSEQFPDYFESNSIDEIALNFGQGDHFLLKEQQIKNLVGWAHSTFEGRAAAFITGSCVMSHKKFKLAVDTFYNEAKALNQPLGIDIVFSPDKKGIVNFAETYRNNIEYVRRLFGHIDIVINMGIDVVRSMTPKDFCLFMATNDFRVSAIQLVPTIDSKHHFDQHWEEIIGWMKELHSIWLESWEKGDPYKFDLNYATVFGRYFDISRDLDIEFNGFVNRYVENRLGREIYIGNDLNVYYGQTGAGDFGLSSRFGFEPIGNINDDKSLLEMFASSKPAYSRMFMKHFAFNPKCSGCEFNKLCLQGGVSIYKNLKLEQDDLGKCPFGLFDMLSLTRDAAINNTEIDNKSYHFVPVYLQNGIESVDAIEKTEGSYEDFDREIKF